MAHHRAPAPWTCLGFASQSQERVLGLCEHTAGDNSPACPRSPRDSQGLASLQSFDEPKEKDCPVVISALVRLCWLRQAPVDLGQVGQRAKLG